MLLYTAAVNSLMILGVAIYFSYLWATCQSPVGWPERIIVIGAWVLGIVGLSAVIGVVL